MRSIAELSFGFADATNYRNSENRNLFNKVFVRTSQLDALCQSNVHFLLGEKGVGKTAYAVYLANNNYKEIAASIKQLDETDYSKFVTLKSKQQLDLSDYKSIWKVIILTLLASDVIKTEDPSVVRLSSQMKALKEAIEQYNQGAFSSEIGQALQFVTESKEAVKIIAKILTASLEQKDAVTIAGNTFQTNLFYIQKNFERAFEQLRPQRSHVIFIDGIDVRPQDIPYDDYLSCIRGLANSVGELNSFFSNVKGDRKKMRVVLLLRPDIFSALNLLNANAKLTDNSVYLKWTTEDNNYRKSEIFRVVDQLFEGQQGFALLPGKSWDSYFRWDADDFRKQSDPTSFVALLRLSYGRPRDFIQMLKLLTSCVLSADPNALVFEKQWLNDNNFKRDYSDYVLGEVRDSFTFYFSIGEFETFLRFFSFLYGRTEFDYSYFIKAYGEYVTSEEKLQKVLLVKSADEFLQFLYGLNVLCCFEVADDGSRFIRWSFKERTFVNIRPKVAVGATYRIFAPLHKALNLGKPLRGEARRRNA